MQLLHCKCYNLGDNVSTPLVLLHGFLADVNEWQNLAATLPKNIPCYAIDLPGHGQSNNIVLEQHNGFNHTSDLINNTLIAQGINTYILLGYSLGGRIALIHSQRFPQSIKGLILESCHFGLNDNQLKTQRLANDEQWAATFSQLPIKQSLHLWYQQPVFSSLSEREILQLIETRQHLCPKSIAKMLLATSLAKQPLIPVNFNQSFFNYYYLFGKNDDKFQQLASELVKQTIRLNNQQNQQKKRVAKQNIAVIIGFNDAGHNIHFQQPVKYNQQIKSLYQQLVNTPLMVIENQIANKKT